MPGGGILLSPGPAEFAIDYYLIMSPPGGCAIGLGPPGGPPGCPPYLCAIASYLRASSNSSSPKVFAEISGSLCKTLKEFLRVFKISVKVFLLSEIVAGSPNAEDKF